jgi:hypothetical protein
VKSTAIDSVKKEEKKMGKILRKHQTESMNTQKMSMYCGMKNNAMEKFSCAYYRFVVESILQCYYNFLQ